MAKKTNLSYQQAVQEIEETLQLIEDAELDVDELSVKVKRIAELIAFCKNKLHTTEKEVEELLSEIDNSED
jgi:exodeoxyribonuclease VII small subunit